MLIKLFGFGDQSRSSSRLSSGRSSCRTQSILKLFSFVVRTPFSSCSCAAESGAGSGDAACSAACGCEWYEVLRQKLAPQLGDRAYLVAAVVGGTNIGKSVVFKLIWPDARRVPAVRWRPERNIPSVWCRRIFKNRTTSRRSFLISNCMSGRTVNVSAGERCSSFVLANRKRSCLHRC